MGREIVTISVPTGMLEWARRRASNGEFASLSDYFRQLIRDDQAKSRIMAAIERERSKEHKAHLRIR